MNTDRFFQEEINTSASGDNTIVAAPTKGHIEIDKIVIMPTGGANTVKFKLAGAGSAANQSPMEQFEFAFDDNQAFVDDILKGKLTCKEATAFIINLSAATKVTGYVLGRIVGE